MDNAKQKLLIELLMSSPDTFALCTGIVKPDYFSPEFRNSVKFIQEYYESYNALPTSKQVAAESGQEFETHDIMRDEIAYCADEIEAFCKQSAIEKAILDAVPLVEKKDYGAVEQLIKDAVTVSLNNDLGLDYFRDVRERLDRLEHSAQRLPTGWAEVDELLFGGHARKELLVFSANSGVGKSVALANYALNQVERGLNALYITLELSEDLISQRYDTMISEVPTAIWKVHKEKIVQAVEKKGEQTGELHVKRMNSGATSRDIRAYLKEFELKFGYVPDVLVVDYLDIMGANEKVSADNVHEKDKRSAEQLRDIGNDYNMAVATASQQNRGAVDEIRVNQSHVAGGISKINTSDTWIAIIANDAMKAAGECRFQFIKTRTSDGVGKQVTLRWTPNIRLVDAAESSIQDFVQREDGKKPTTVDAVKHIVESAASNPDGPFELTDIFDVD